MLKEVEKYEPNYIWVNPLLDMIDKFISCGADLEKSNFQKELSRSLSNMAAASISVHPQKPQ
jgi:hypothetical protein